MLGLNLVNGSRASSTLSFFSMGLRVGVLALLVLLVGCSSAPKSPISEQGVKPAHDASIGGQIKVKKKPNAIDLTQEKPVKQALVSQFSLWKGTPYQYGGSTLKGTDCSSYVQSTFRDKLGYILPRDTRSQVRVGYTVDKSALKIGDIVFFKVAKNTIHNGIYLGQSRFMHASTSLGVTISSLENDYWRNSYWTARSLR
ncbi:NlpC/P60 family protein [Thiomicrorhabdus aquaedulcis]|uniref:NlpC/P60 family protein n=1 Tax=Thiomicrorhabdus aquaedulcis TaxID=2211106 RepID=UPI0018D55992|nr:NlpC/P60 family protein [Thiomicrorhabdus aquaedulcis]